MSEQLGLFASRVVDYVRETMGLKSLSFVAYEVRDGSKVLCKFSCSTCRQSSCDCVLSACRMAKIHQCKSVRVVGIHDRGGFTVLLTRRRSDFANEAVSRQAIYKSARRPS